MREPGYQERTRAELRKALRWAIHRLCLEGWTVSLAFDAAAERDNDPDETDSGSAWVTASSRQAGLKVWMASCEDNDDDPIYVVFHELAHVALWPIRMVDKDYLLKLHWEFLVNLYAKLLYDLWSHEQEAT